MILFKPLRREIYDETHPSATYHAEWSRRMADRARAWAWFAITLSVIAFVLTAARALS